jgi:hypothetical protein
MLVPAGRALAYKTTAGLTLRPVAIKSWPVRIAGRRASRASDRQSPERQRRVKAPSGVAR